MAKFLQFAALSALGANAENILASAQHPQASRGVTKTASKNLLASRNGVVRQTNLIQLGAGIEARAPTMNTQLCYSCKTRKMLFKVLCPIGEKCLECAGKEWFHNTGACLGSHKKEHAEKAFRHHVKTAGIAVFDQTLDEYFAEAQEDQEIEAGDAWRIFSEVHNQQAAEKKFIDGALNDDDGSKSGRCECTSTPQGIRTITIVDGETRDACTTRCQASSDMESWEWSIAVVVGEGDEKILHTKTWTQTTPAPEIISYKFGQPLGEGTFGVTVLATGPVNGRTQSVAIKEISGSEDTNRDNREAEIQKSLKNENIAELFYSFRVIGKEFNSLYLVMQYCASGTLLDKMTKKGSARRKKNDAQEKEIIVLNDGTTRDYVRQVVSALDYIGQSSNKELIHRDIKPENILVHGEILKLTDFGLSTMQGNSRSGTPPYMAPEVVSEADYCPPADMWSVGVMTFGMLLGRFPFNIPEGATDEAIYAAVKNFNPDNLDFEGRQVSQEAQDFIKMLLVRNPADRLTPEKALAHPWLKASDQ